MAPRVGSRSSRHSLFQHTGTEKNVQHSRTAPHNVTVVAFVKSFRTVDVDPINLTGAWLKSDTATRFGINERYQAVVENQDGGYDSC